MMQQALSLLNPAYKYPNHKTIATYFLDFAYKDLKVQVDTFIQYLTSTLLAMKGPILIVLEYSTSPFTAITAYYIGSLKMSVTNR